MTWEGAEFAHDGEASGALEVRWVGEGEQHLLALQGRISARLGLWGLFEFRSTRWSQVPWFCFWM